MNTNEYRVQSQEALVLGRGGATQQWGIAEDEGEREKGVLCIFLWEPKYWRIERLSQLIFCLTATACLEPLARLWRRILQPGLTE